MISIHEVLKPGRKGLFYGRHSTDDQTLETQLFVARNLVQEFGCEIIKEFKDENVSAVKRNMDKRQGLADLMDYIEINTVDFVVIYDHTRLARNAMEHQKIRAIMNAKKIPVVMSSTRDLYNTGDLLGQLLKDGYSKYEADAIRQRTEDNHYKFIRQGVYRGGKLPFGYLYSHEKYKFVVLEDQKQIVIDIFNKYREGEGLLSIAASLPEKSFHGRDWKKDDVKMIITNPFYVGYLTAKRFRRDYHKQLTEKEQWIMGFCDRIETFIRYEEWELCYEMYRSKRSGTVSPKKYKTPFFLRDILFCMKCHKALKSKNQMYKYHNGKDHGNSIYYCENKACKLRLISTEVHGKFIEEELTAILLKYLSTSHKDLHSEIMSKLQQDILALTQQIRLLEAQVEEYILQIHRAEVEFQTLSSDEDKPQELKNSFLRYRIQLKEKITNIKKLIVERKHKIQYIENVESDIFLMKDVLQKTISLEYKGDVDPRLRRIVLYVYERIEIDENLNYTYQARIDLENIGPVVLSGLIL
ncbi:recombinase family protein [Paenibacillus sp. Soil787]|uniref:recombinase family protein n=1 Tax=Paenibacillus sp. Soil787 TaxID=1736411 RepID=UPI000702C983|nr:recombinase family protein [Paenibacillus sp. Soil787]KRF18648.1 hypothetical protein ASG93_11465 [Paenibacillus sp. Soil787]